jgi:hypothetical protein
LSDVGYRIPDIGTLDYQIFRLSDTCWDLGSGIWDLDIGASAGWLGCGEPDLERSTVDLLAVQGVNGR